MKYLENHYYHIYNRGAHKQKIFFEEENYLYLIGLLEKYIERYNITIVAYCLMPNHYHIVAKQNAGGDIGRYLKTIFNAYTQAINKRFGLSGTLFQGQAKAKHIDSDEYCLQVIRYIHRNPVTAKLVDAIEKWEYSNYHEWVGNRDGKLMDSELRSGYFKNPIEYKLFLDEYVDIKRIDRFLFNEE